MLDKYWEDLQFRTLDKKEIEIRPELGNPKVPEGYVEMLLYKDARVDANILDETVGRMNWQRRHSNQNRNCTVSIYDPSKQCWIEKEDAGSEGYGNHRNKALASDSFKRSCFAWGIGRELYTAPKIIVPASLFTWGGKNKDVILGKLFVRTIEVKEGKITALECAYKYNDKSILFYSTIKKINLYNRKKIESTNETAA